MAGKKRPGRRSLCTKDRIDRIVALMKNGANFKIAAKGAGIGESTLHLWLKKGRETKRGNYYKLLKGVESAEAECANFCLSTIKTASLEKWQAGAWLLERRFFYHKPMQPSAPAPAVDLPTDPKELMIMQLQDLRSAMAKAQASESWQAYAALQRQMLRVMAQLKQLASEDGTDALQIMTDEQLIAEITQAVVSLPPVLRQRLESQLFELSNVVSIKG